MSRQVEGLLVKSNELLLDINGKVATIDPLFTAVADLSESVSELNHSSKTSRRKSAESVKRQLKRRLPESRWDSDEILKQNILKRQEENKMAKRWILLGAVVGGTAAAIAALLLAPKSGKELRDELAAQADDLMDMASDYTDMAKENRLS